MTTTTDQRSHYEVLGVPENATAAQIKKAYRSKARVTHPDQGGTTAAFQAVEEAHRVLINESTRSAYDDELVRTRPAMAAAGPRPAAQRAPLYRAQYVHRGAFNSHGARASRAERLATNCERIDREAGAGSAQYRARRYRELVRDAVAAASPLRRSAPGWSAPLTVLGAIAVGLIPRLSTILEGEAATTVPQAMFPAIVVGLSLWAAYYVRRRRGPLPALETVVVAVLVGAMAGFAERIVTPAAVPVVASVTLGYAFWFGAHLALRPPMTGRSARSYRAWIGENVDVVRDMISLSAAARRSRS